MVTRLTLITIDRWIGHPFEHLMQLGQVIDVVFDFPPWLIGGRLNVDLDDVTSLVSGVDLCLQRSQV